MQRWVGDLKLLNSSVLFSKAAGWIENFNGTAMFYEVQPFLFCVSIGCLVITKVSHWARLSPNLQYISCRGVRGVIIKIIMRYWKETANAWPLLQKASFLLRCNRRISKWTCLPRTMASIWVAFFSFCWEIFLLLMVFRDVWVLPFLKATTGAASVRPSWAVSPFFSDFCPSSGGVGGVEVGLTLALLGINVWWLVAGVSPRAHWGCCRCLWLQPLLLSSSSSRSSPSLTPSLMNIWYRPQWAGGHWLGWSIFICVISQREAFETAAGQCSQY